MIVFDEKKYNVWITEETIRGIEEDYGVKAVIGALIGTRVHEVDNRGSDFDFHLICQKGPGGKDAFTVFDETTFLDVAIFDWDYLRAEGRAYMNGISRYPSILHRTGSGPLPSINMLRQDYGVAALFEMLCSDYIWISEEYAGRIEALVEEIPYLGILDYYYSRAYGNLQNQLVKDMVPTNRCLMSFIGYGCMRWLLEERTIPDMRFSSMLERYAPHELRDYLIEACRRQRGLDTQRNIQQRKFETDGETLLDLFQAKAEQRGRIRLKEERSEAKIERSEAYNAWLRTELADIAAKMDALSSYRTTKERVSAVDRGMGRTDRPSADGQTQKLKSGGQALLFRTRRENT